MAEDYISSRCVQCNCVLPDNNRSIVQYAISNKRVCEVHYNEINKWINSEVRTYKEWDETASKTYPRIWSDDKFYKNLGRY